MDKTVQGTIHGRTIELDEDIGLTDGQKVQIQIRADVAPEKWGDGLRRCAGALADEWTEEDDRILQEIYESRKHDTRPEPEIDE